MNEIDDTDPAITGRERSIVIITALAAQGVAGSGFADTSAAVKL